MNARQFIHAKQAAKGLEDHIDFWTRQLTFLSQFENSAILSPKSKKIFAQFYNEQKDEIGSLLRVNEKGIIVSAPSDPALVGKDISFENHIKEMSANRKTIISDVFFALQGYNAIAIHVPVFDGNRFCGSIGSIIKIESVGKRFLEDIRIGESGYAWMLSRDGAILYSPYSEHTGKSIFEIAKNFPSMIETAKRMMSGEEGYSTYTFNQAKGNKNQIVKKYAVFVPVKLPSTHWSIIVASAEEDVLNSLIAFRNRLYAIILLLLIAGIIFTYYVMKTRSIIKESDLNKKVELQLQNLNAELENKVRQRTAQLEKTNQELEGFNYTVSHDLRAPLRAINGYIQILSEEYNDIFDKEASALLDRMKRAADKMDSLIESILRLSRLNYHHMEIADVNLSVLTRSTAKEMQNLYNENAYELKVEDNIETRGDYGLITLLLENLLGNAFKFSSKTPNPVIEFFSINNSGAKIFCIKDNGAGFVGAKDEKLFTPFKRFHSEYEFGGIGIGLAIAKKIVEKHNGTIWAESKPDNGAVFYFTLNI